jgi:inosine/xanthosine triphosphatase
MKINIGTTNELKIKTIRDTVALYSTLFVDPVICGVDVKVEKYGFPATLEETISGAVQRAKKAFNDCDYSVGIEGGFMKVLSDDYNQYVETSVCSIYNGKDIYIGISSAFEWPADVVEQVLKGGVDGIQTFKEMNTKKGLAVGEIKNGMCDYLTNGRIKREDQIKESFIMAMIKIEKKEFYK